MSEALRTITFEGFSDEKSGWEFERPLYMVHPRLWEAAGSPESMVEDYLIGLSLCDNLDDAPDLALARKWFTRQLRRARTGRTSRYLYWTQTVTIEGNNGFPDGGFGTPVWEGVEGMSL